MDKPFVKITMSEGGKAQVELSNMTLLELTYGSMLLLDKVYENLKAQGHLEMMEVVGSILQSLAALVQLAATPNSGEVN
jgi:hypothetical protein